MIMHWQSRWKVTHSWGKNIKENEIGIIHYIKYKFERIKRWSLTRKFAKSKLNQRFSLDFSQAFDPTFYWLDMIYILQSCTYHSDLERFLWRKPLKCNPWHWWLSYFLLFWAPSQKIFISSPFQILFENENQDLTEMIEKGNMWNSRYGAGKQSKQSAALQRLNKYWHWTHRTDLQNQISSIPNKYFRLF